MNRARHSLVALTATLLLAARIFAQDATPSTHRLPDETESPRMKKWMDMHYGLFLHFGMNTMADTEHVARKQDPKNIIAPLPIFSPTGLGAYPVCCSSELPSIALWIIPNHAYPAVPRLQQMRPGRPLADYATHCAFTDVALVTTSGRQTKRLHGELGKF